MASTTGAPALSTDIESGKFDEKEAHPVPAKAPVEEEEEDEDIDALIDDLESNDGHGDVSFSSAPHFPPPTAPRARLGAWVRPITSFNCAAWVRRRRRPFSPSQPAARANAPMPRAIGACAGPASHHFTTTQSLMLTIAMCSSRRRRRSPPAVRVLSPRTCCRPTPVSVSHPRRCSSAAANMVSTR